MEVCWVPVVHVFCLLLAALVSEICEENGDTDNNEVY